MDGVERFSFFLVLQVYVKVLPAGFVSMRTLPFGYDEFVTMHNQYAGNGFKVGEGALFP